MKEIKLKISPGNRKLGNIPNISTVPIKDCMNCDACKKDCYALKAWRLYPNVRKAWNNNSKVFRKHVDIAFSEIEKYLTGKINTKYFRIHQAGDFIDQKQVNEWKKLARKFPDIKFMAFTKRWKSTERGKALQFKNMPKNFVVMFSQFPNEKDMPRDKTKFIAWVQDKKNPETRIPDDVFICPDKCDTCGHCWQPDKDVMFIKH